MARNLGKRWVFKGDHQRIKGLHRTVPAAARAQVAGCATVAPLIFEIFVQKLSRNILQIVRIENTSCKKIDFLTRQIRKPLPSNLFATWIKHG